MNQILPNRSDIFVGKYELSEDTNEYISVLTGKVMNDVYEDQNTYPYPPDLPLRL